MIYAEGSLSNFVCCIGGPVYPKHSIASWLIDERGVTMVDPYPADQVGPSQTCRKPRPGHSHHPSRLLRTSERSHVSTGETVDWSRFWTVTARCQRISSAVSPN